MLTQQGNCGLLQGTLNHVRLTVALLLSALLAYLWHTGHGPGAAVACCGSAPVVSEAPVSVAESAPTPMAESAASVTLTNPNAQVLPSASTLAPWNGPTPPAFEHEVQYPVAKIAEPVAEESPVPETAPAEPAPAAAPAPATEVAEQAPAEPTYTLTDPNAQVLQSASTLSAWTGPTFPKLEHFVYYPPAAAPAVEPAVPASAELPPTARVYFATSKWDLPADIDATLASIVRFLKAHPESKAVIQGFHDPRGNADVNEILAKNRAGAIWDALIAAGIARDRIELQKPVNTVGSGSLAEARRAEVSVVRQ